MHTSLQHGLQRRDQFTVSVVRKQSEENSPELLGESFSILFNPWKIPDTLADSTTLFEPKFLKAKGRLCACLSSLSESSCGP